MKNLHPLGLATGLLLSLLTGQAAAQTFEVRLDPSVATEALDGRLLLLLSSTKSFRPGENGTPIFGIDVSDMKPGASAALDGTALGHPLRSLNDIPPGDYFAKAYLHRYTRFERADGHTLLLHADQGEGQSWQRAPGNLFSEVTEVHIDNESTDPIQLTLNQVIPPIEPRADTEWIKHVRIQSKLLSTFWGQPMFIGATILLPRDFYSQPDELFPVVYMQGHFSSRAPMGFGSGRGFDKFWMGEDAPQELLVTIQHATPYYDDSYGVNSANMGPYGDAIVTELIPELESRFHAIAKPYARALTGGSTGGWISVGMQVLYADFFGGCWSFYPDQLDFRGYQVVNILHDKNAYFKEHEWSRVARPGMRETNGNISYTMEQENLYEEVIGTRSRSGGQWAAWNAVFAPVAEDGYPQPIWDPITGVIDHKVAREARKSYDMRFILQRDWKTLGPKLAGKLHIFVGRMDNYYLEQGVYRLEAFLKSTDSPPYGGTIEYGDRAGHGWSPFERNELPGIMLKHMQANAPAK